MVISVLIEKLNILDYHYYIYPISKETDTSDLIQMEILFQGVLGMILEIYLF